jgi:hypothetical protein
LLQFFELEVEVFHVSFLLVGCCCLTDPSDTPMPHGPLLVTISTLGRNNRKVKAASGGKIRRNGMVSTRRKMDSRD